MDQPHDSLTPPPPLQVGQQHTILQLGNQTFLILPGGQPGSPLQAIPLNLLPIGSPIAPTQQTPGGPHPTPVIAGGKPPGGGGGQPCVVQVPGLPMTRPPLTAPTNEANLKTSQASAVPVGSTVAPPQAAPQHPAPHMLKVGPNAVVKVGPDAMVQNIFIQGAGAPLMVQPNFLQVGGSAVEVACVVPTHQATTFQPPTNLHPPQEAPPKIVQVLPTIPFQAQVPASKMLEVRSQSATTMLPRKTINRSASRLQPNSVPVGGAQPASRRKRPTSRKGVSKAQQGPAFNAARVRHAATNTPGTSVSFARQAATLPDLKSQAVQFPEGGSPIKCPVQTTCEEGDSGQNAEEGMPQTHLRVQAHFDDVAIYFSEEEWRGLSNKQKKLYKKVMMDNYWNLVAVGKVSVTPPLIVKIEKGEEPCVCGPQSTDPDANSKENLLRTYKEHYFVQRLYERLKVFTAPIRMALAGRGTASEPSAPARDEETVSDSAPLCPYQSLVKEKPVIDETPFSCYKCPRRFPRLCNLISHFRCHQRELNMACPECGKAFDKGKALVLHLMKHKGERPFICPGCGKSFASQVCLDNHTKQQPYKCPQCGKLFSLKHALVTHQRIHNPDNPNVCPVCGKAFLHRSALLQHHKVHQKSSFVCPECGLRFVSRGECVRHMRDYNHTLEYPSQEADHPEVREPDGGFAMDFSDLVIKMEEDDGSY